MLLLSQIGKSALALGLLLACASNSRAMDEADIAEELANLGVQCKYDDDANVVAVEFGYFSLATDEDLVLLKGLDHLEEVEIHELDLGNVGFTHLASLSHLKRLYVSGIKCIDADIEHLAGLTALEDLGLSDTAVTDASIAKLLKLPHLKWINLSSTRVTPEGLRRLRRGRPRLHVAESWNYFAGIVNGRGVLDLPCATIVFADIRGSKSAGGGGGGAIQVSRSLDEQEGDVPLGSAGGASFGSGGLGVISASVTRKNGIPTIRVGKHQIEIKGEGTELVVDGQSFRLAGKKRRIVVDADGTVTLE